MTANLVEVVAAVILNDGDEFLLSSRPEGKPYAGYWEFAGGKVEAGESLFAALQRELNEELGIEIVAATPWLTKIHHYEHASVHLHFFRVAAHEWYGDIVCQEGQTYSWQQAGRFDVQPMLPANGPILRALSLPLTMQGNQADGFGGSNGTGSVLLRRDADNAQIWCLQRLQDAFSRQNGLQDALLRLQILPPDADVQDCPADGWWLELNHIAAIDDLAARLQNGSPVPILAIVPERLAPFIDRLLEQGVHVAYDTEQAAS